MTHRSKNQKRSRSGRHAGAAFCAAIVVLIAVTVFFRFSGGTGEPTGEVSVVSADAVSETLSESDAESADAAEAVQADPVTITLSFVGDCTLGTDEYFNYSTSLNAYYEQYGADYFFEGVRDVFEADDLTVVNLEGTLTTSTTRADKTYAFKGAPEYVSILTGSSVEAANVANNHSHDYGSQSYTDTVETLESNGIAHFGYDDIALLDVQGITVGLVGIYELAEGTGVSDQVSANIQAAREAGADIVVVSFHWGTEKMSCAESTQVELAHLAVDAGADLVIGHHPHVLQGIEYYNGKVIAYSLGNFCFGGNSNPSDKDTIIFQMCFTVQKDTDADAEILSSEMNLIPCRLSSVTSYNDYQPTILTGDEAQEVLDKLDARSQELADAYGVSVYSSGQ